MASAVSLRYPANYSLGMLANLTDESIPRIGTLVSRHLNVLLLSKAIPIIAIVDDDEAVREATKTLVRSLGYNASMFDSADEFLKSEQVKTHRASSPICICRD